MYSLSSTEHAHTHTNTVGVIFQGKVNWGKTQVFQCFWRQEWKKLLEHNLKYLVGKSGFYINQKPDFKYKLNFVSSYLDYCYIPLWEVTSGTFGSEFVNKHHCICSKKDSWRSRETVTNHVHPYWIINCLLYNEMSLRQIASSWKVVVS